MTDIYVTCGAVLFQFRYAKRVLEVGWGVLSGLTWPDHHPVPDEDPEEWSWLGPPSR